MLRHPCYLLLKANADQLPVRAQAVSLVIATPPYVGTKRLRKGEYCTDDPDEYAALMNRFLKEATRILKPGGHILLHTNDPPVPRVNGVPQIVFKVFQKQAQRGGWTSPWIHSETFPTRNIYLKDYIWQALPIWVYRSLLEKYSQPNETVAHVFSGSGNGGIAALQLARNALLVDLHYHRQIQRRLRKRSRSLPAPRERPQASARSPASA